MMSQSPSRYDATRPTAEQLAGKIQDCADIPDGVPWSQEELDLIEKALRSYAAHSETQRPKGNYDPDETPEQLAERQKKLREFQEYCGKAETDPRPVVVDEESLARMTAIAQSSDKNDALSLAFKHHCDKTTRDQEWAKKLVEEHNAKVPHEQR